MKPRFTQTNQPTPDQFIPEPTPIDGFDEGLRASARKSLRCKVVKHTRMANARDLDGRKMCHSATNLPLILRLPSVANSGACEFRKHGILFLNSRGVRMVTTRAKIIRRIHRGGAGHAFTPKDFLDLGSRAMVDVTLSQLVSEGVIRRVSRGLYDLPKHSEALGITLSPDIDEIAHAYARDSAGESSLPVPGQPMPSASRHRSQPGLPICPMVRTGRLKWGNRPFISSMHDPRKCEPRARYRAWSFKHSAISERMK